MSTPSGSQAGWKTYHSGRFWILGAVLGVLSGLALVQYRWINRVAEAQRQRAQASLSAALSGLESDFDTEITRAYLAFQFPFANPDYAERREAWMQHAPYAGLIRGIYIAESRGTGFVVKAVLPGDPAILATDWRRYLPELRPPLTGASMSSPVSGPMMGFQAFSRGQVKVEFGPPLVETTIDGNPAFVFPIDSVESGASRFVAAVSGAAPVLPGQGIVTARTSIRSLKWAVLILDTEYIREIFLPRLVNLYFRNAASSDYDILVVNRDNGGSARVVFSSEAAPSESEFGPPDGRISLLQLRLDCFSPPPSTNAIGATNPAINRRVQAADILSEILARRPPTCSNPPAKLGNGSGGLWELLVRDRAGSLDQAMATFRRRNLILSGSVLLVLAVGICMLVLVTERARSLAEMQTEFVLGVSHELRTPLTVIRLAADNLRKSMVENSEHARKYGELIHVQASELSNMIEETLTFARMRSTPIAPNLVLTSPEQMLKSALADCEDALQQANIRTELDVARDIPRVNVDVRLLKSCIQNLIENEIKYAAQGGWLAIRAKAVKRSDVEMVEISVEDRGPGVPAPDLAHIFEPFYRGKQAESSGVRGLGLGLTLVKRVVEGHRGFVCVQNLEKGAKFSIFLPADTTQGRTPEAS